MGIVIDVTYRMSCDWPLCRAATTLRAPKLTEARRLGRREGWTVSAVHVPSGYFDHARCPAHAHRALTLRTGRPPKAEACERHPEAAIAVDGKCSQCYPGRWFGQMGKHSETGEDAPF